jgi:hypothetical protein
MWPEDRTVSSKMEYLDRLNHLDEIGIYNNYVASHYTSLQLLYRKYHFYRKAIKSIQIVVLVNFGGLFFVILDKVLQVTQHG